MKKLFLMLICCIIIAAISAHQTTANNNVVVEKLADYNVYASNSTDGQVAVYFTGNNAGLRGYVAPGSSDVLGPIPGGTYSVLVTTNATGTRTFTVNGQSVTTDNGQASFNVDVTASVYITVQ
jgi:hypothetical protein